MVDRRAGARVEGVRIALAVLFEIVAVIARGRDAVAVQRQYLLGDPLALARRFDSDAPGRAVRLAPFGFQLAGDFRQVAAHASSFRRSPTASTV